MTNDTKVSDGCREVVFRIVIREVDGAPRVVESGVWPVSEPQRPALGEIDVDWLSQVIRKADGNHSLGAGALAEAIIAALASKA
jgi:hypothetical protein